MVGMNSMKQAVVPLHAPATRTLFGNASRDVARNAAQRGIGDIGQLGAARAIHIALHRCPHEHRHDAADDAGEHDHHDHLDQGESLLSAQYPIMARSSVHSACGNRPAR